MQKSSKISKKKNEKKVALYFHSTPPKGLKTTVPFLRFLTAYKGKVESEMTCVCPPPSKLNSPCLLLMELLVPFLQRKRKDLATPRVPLLNRY